MAYMIFESFVSDGTRDRQLKWYYKSSYFNAEKNHKITVQQSKDARRSFVKDKMYK